MPSLLARSALGPLAGPVADRLEALVDDRVASRLAERDATLWPGDEELIADRLGWLDLPEGEATDLEAIEELAEELRAAGSRRVLHCGMGGSGLVARVVSRTLGPDEPGEDAIELRVLDGTDPETVLDAHAWLRDGPAGIVVVSKSGTTLETRSFHAHLGEAADLDATLAMVTDPGSPLERRAREGGATSIFAHPPDVGGRFAALSVVGLLPVALVGSDPEALLEAGREMMEVCAPDETTNPGLELGAVLGEAARRGRDKLTLATGPDLAPLLPWVEQLVAESTGKDGRGILPVTGEALGPPEVYGEDRLFCVLGDPDEEDASRLEALEEAGLPVHRIPDPGPDGPGRLGAEAVRWEVATVVAAAVLEVNPFDEPDVAGAKTRTRELLGAVAGGGELPEPRPDAEGRQLVVRGDPHLRMTCSGTRPAAWLAAHLDRVGPGDHLALLPFLPREDPTEATFRAIRERLRDHLRVPVTVGWGPGYLHSTGQLHKGGPPTGAFLLVTYDPEVDVGIPGEEHGFATLQRAQALGDLESLLELERRVLGVHLRGWVAEGLDALEAAVGSVAGGA